MFRTIGTVAVIALANALKLENQSQAMKLAGLTDYSAWNTTTAKYNSLKNGGKFTDSVFPPTDDSYGKPKGDAARGSQGSNGGAVTWKRLGDIYGADTKLFAHKETFSTAQQGQLGDCYFISTILAFDSRPGALEGLFVDKTVNANGIYAVKFYVNGEPVIVHVDDHVPVIKKWVQIAGKWTQVERPVFADSRINGEIWPCILEKAWAKLIGTYGDIESGNNWWVLQHLTNDPTERVVMRNQGYSGTNSKGVALWQKMKRWSDKEFLIFVGSDNQSYVTGHAFTVLSLQEIKVGGVTKKMVMMRNPWGSSKWTGAYSTKGTSTYDALDKAIAGGIKTEGGKFWMEFGDFVKQYSRVYMAYSQETRTAGGTNRAEYRPTIKLSGTGKQFIRFRLFDDVDLKTQYFAFENIQGGNRVSTTKNPAQAKFSTVYLRYAMTPTDPANTFSKAWGGWGVHAAMWDLGDAGNAKLFNEQDGSTFPKGEYVIEINPDWKSQTAQYPVLKEMTVRVSSPVKVVMEQLSADQATRAMSGGNVKSNRSGVSCEAYGNRHMGSGKSMADYGKLAAAAGATQFMFAPTQTQWGAYWCSATFPENTTNFSSLMNIYDVISPPQPVAPMADPGNNTPAPTPVPAAPTPTPAPAKPTPEPTPVKPVVPAKWAPTDPNYLYLKNKMAGKSWNAWYGYDYRVVTRYRVTRNGKRSDYYCEGLRNNDSKTKLFTLTFDSKWEIVSHKADSNNTIKFNLDPQADAYVQARYKDVNTSFTWGLYDMTMK